jgi:D-lyxose ketol-isomerase
MKRSHLNQAYRRALRFFERHGWHLPPNPRWDITDYGLEDFSRAGLVLINLAEEPEYSEKLMYARRNQQTPAHTHREKKEDIICRTGELTLQVWCGHPEKEPEPAFELQVNNAPRTVRSGERLLLHAGERATITPGIYHAFWPNSEECIIAEVSTRNDDEHDNFFVNPDIGRFPDIEEDEPPEVRLLSEK